MDISLESKLIKLNKHLPFPLTSEINEDSGVRDFITDMDNYHISIYIYIYILTKLD